MEPFKKKALTLKEMIDLLKQRWLKISDEKKAKHILQHTWYYRLSWYFKSYQNGDDIYNEWINFNDIWDTYIFDRKLRLHTLDAIEKIEVSLKSNINDILSLKKWCWRYLEESNFDLTPKMSPKYIWKQPQDIYDNLISKIKDIRFWSRENIKHYVWKYTPSDIPSRILFEELTIGEISNIYNILPKTIRQEIADVYWLYDKDLKRRITTLVNIRNICAHHGRLWNRKYPFKIRAKDTKIWSKLQKYRNDKWWSEAIPNYYNLTIMFNYLLSRINKNFNWVPVLRKILKSHKNKYNKRMWFNARWYKHL